MVSGKTKMAELHSPPPQHVYPYLWNLYCICHVFQLLLAQKRLWAIPQSFLTNLHMTLIPLLYTHVNRVMNIPAGIYQSHVWIAAAGLDLLQFVQVGQHSVSVCMSLAFAFLQQVLLPTRVIFKAKSTTGIAHTAVIPVHISDKMIQIQWYVSKEGSYPLLSWERKEKNPPNWANTNMNLDNHNYNRIANSLPFHLFYYNAFLLECRFVT